MPLSYETFCVCCRCIFTPNFEARKISVLHEHGSTIKEDEMKMCRDCADEIVRGIIVDRPHMGYCSSAGHVQEQDPEFENAVRAIENQ